MFAGSGLNFWVTEVLRGIARCSADTGVSAVFKGGTSLSKAFGLIRRFSEDADGTLVFTPAVVMTAHEAALLRHPELVEQIEADRADPTRAIRSTARRPH